MLNYRDYMSKTTDQKRDLFLELVSHTDAVCDACLDEEYCELCRELTAELVRKGRFVFKGRIQGLASGIVHAVGWANFLDDPTQPCYMTSADLAQRCGVSHSRMMDKSRQVRKFLRMIPMDPRWCRADKLLDNPNVWMIQVNGIIIDARTTSRELQIAAFDQGVIPFIPPDDWSRKHVKEPARAPAKKTTGKKKPTPPNGTLSLFDQTPESSGDRSEDV